jgi:aconitate hydratase
MVRGTFANLRVRNQLVPGIEGGVTLLFPEGEQIWIYDAAKKYAARGVPLIVIAGREYGTGSSRDWAAKGVRLMGVRAVIAGSFERIHRSNLIGMGVLPLEFLEGDSWESLGLTGKETFDIKGLSSLSPMDSVEVTASLEGGKKMSFFTRARIDTPHEMEYFEHGGILPYVLRQILKQ